MKKVLLVSPHFDDAVLSAGQFMAGRPDCDVITVFAGYPKPENLDMSTPYDRKCGFETARDAVTVRRQEDNRALALLGANFYHLDFPDSQYKELVDLAAIWKEVQGMLTEFDYDFVMAPLGLGHPDHVSLSNLIVSHAEDIQKLWGIPLYLWEDLPIRVVEPELVHERLKLLRSLRPVERAFPGDGEIALKIRALSCYNSQIGTGILDPFIMYVPERFYEVK